VEGPLIATVKRHSGVPARVQVYDALREAIVSAELEPGRQLSENELAARLGVSRTPIREALVRLREERLVNIVPQLGTFVARISDEAVADAQFIREALECAAIRCAADRLTPEQLELLQENVAAQDRAGARDDHDGFFLLDEDFHHRLCDLSGHATVWSVSERAKSHLNRVRRLSLTMPSYVNLMIDEHRAVVAALARQDAQGAEAALRHHLRMVLSELPHIREQHPDYFEESS
jgi:DNA-binding GntR family transcriptional regulator